MKKRILSILLAFAMIFTLMPTAFAVATTTYQVVTVDKTTVKQGETVNVKVTLPNISETAGSFTVVMNFDKNKFEVTDRKMPPTLTATNTEFENTENVSIVANGKANANTNGQLTANAAYVYNTIQVAGVTVVDATLKAKTDVSGEIAFSFEIFEITYSDNGTQYIVKKDQLETPPSVTILKAPISDASKITATVATPHKGVPLATSVNLGGATAYTGAVKWYVGETEAMETTAKADTAYTAKITLTANSGESFAKSLNGKLTNDAYEIRFVNADKLELTLTFLKTENKTLKGIDIITNPALTVSVPTAAPNATATNERSLAITGVYDDNSVGPVEGATWKITTDPIPKGVSLDGSTLKVTNEAEACKVRVEVAAAGFTDAEEITITKDTLKPSAIVATVPATGTNITIPNGGTETSGNCSYKVYDQYGAEMTGSHATWKMKLEPATATGVHLIDANGSISVTNNATTCKATLYAEIGGVKSNEITFNIARAASVATSLTIDGSADSVTVPTVSEPGTTKCEYASYTAKVKDQYGAEMTGQTIAWSVTENPGVAINNGQLTVTNKATAGNVTITAKSGTLKATKTVTINKDAAKVSIVKITAQDNEPPVTTIICTGSQRSEDYTATVYDQYGEEKQDDVNWSLDPPTSGVTYEVSATNNNIVTLKVAPNTAAGSFKLVATSQTVTTVKGELEIKVQKKNDVNGKINFNDGSLTYKGEGQKYENAALDSSVTAGTGGKWTYTYAVSGGGTLDAAGLPKTVGTYTVTATYEDSLNIGSKSVTLNIKPREVAIPAPDNTVYTYDGTAKTYRISASADYTVNHATQTEANEVGHTVTVALTDATNTTWPGGNTGVQIYYFKIMKATPTGEPSYTEITAAGKTLADADLKTGTITPLGTIKWVEVDGTTVLPDTTPVAKNKAYNWLFTPADTANYNTLTGSLTPYYVASSGGNHVSKVQKPEITIIGSGKADLSADGRTATITAAAGHELVSVVLNGKEMGKIEKLTGLKTGDKATITFRAKTDGKAEMDKIIAQKASKLTLMARSKKTAKLNIKVVVKGDLKAITDAGYTIKYKFYRSTKKSAGYKAVLTKKAPTYYNTYGKKGTMYYYKARVMIYDKNGNFVAQTALKQCKYANRLWTK